MRGFVQDGTKLILIDHFLLSSKRTNSRETSMQFCLEPKQCYLGIALYS